jgi:protease secretion system outer membrane protein
MRQFSLRPAGLALACLLAVQANVAASMGLLEAYEAALQNDAVYQAAIFEHEAGQQNIELGRASLLPNVAVNYSSNRNHADLTSQNFQGAPVTSHPDYNSKGTSISLRQPLFNLEAVARYRQGAAQTDYSSAVFSLRRKELILRVAEGYSEAQNRQSQLALAKAQRNTYAEQMKVNERLFQKGEGTKTDILETRARLELAEAQVIEAQDNLTNAVQLLEAMTSRPALPLDDLSPTIHLQREATASVDQWKALALEKNDEIKALRHGLEIARQEINKNKSGHMPRVDLIAGYSRNSGETLNTYNQDSTVRSVGIQLTIPLYSGGYVSAATTRAEAGYKKAEADLDTSVRRAFIELHKQYNLVRSSAARIDALSKAVKSAQLLITATQQSIKGGVRINLDLLGAQQQLYMAERDLTQAKYAYLLSDLRLRSVTGALDVTDLQKMKGYFTSPGL